MPSIPEIVVPISYIARARLALTQPCPEGGTFISYIARARLALTQPCPEGGTFFWAKDFPSREATFLNERIAYLPGADRDPADHEDMGRPAGLWVRFDPAPLSPIEEGPVEGTIDAHTVEAWGIDQAGFPARVLRGPRPDGTDGVPLVYWQRQPSGDVEVRRYVGGGLPIPTAGCHGLSWRQPTWMLVTPVEVSGS